MPNRFAVSASHIFFLNFAFVSLVVRKQFEQLSGLNCCVLCKLVQQGTFYWCCCRGKFGSTTSAASLKLFGLSSLIASAGQSLSVSGPYTYVSYAFTIAARFNACHIVILEFMWRTTQNASQAIQNALTLDSELHWWPHPAGDLATSCAPLNASRRSHCGPSGRSLCWRAFLASAFKWQQRSARLSKFHNITSSTLDS